VLRDLLEIHGPKYGCGLMVCKACTCLITGQARQICGIPVGKLKHTDEVITIEGLAGSVGKDLHPMQEAWLDVDVAQCGYCQPGQIMDAVGLVTEIHAMGRQVTDADLDLFRNECRCGTYPRSARRFCRGRRRWESRPDTSTRRSVAGESIAAARAPSARSRGRVPPEYERSLERIGRCDAVDAARQHRLRARDCL
jgi:isoquinoline 1-oxidoreductase alpha subunit